MRFLLLALALPLAACTAKTTPPDAPKPPHAIGMANPASVYCLEKGGEQIPVQSPQGVRTECKLPGGDSFLRLLSQKNISMNALPSRSSATHQVTDVYCLRYTSL